MLFQVIAGQIGPGVPIVTEISAFLWLYLQKYVTGSGEGHALLKRL